jgi:bis(5'-nucleosyl)-tetraphosphatase (symmetrical)
MWVADDAEILFVGDIQGCARELARLLDRAGFNPAKHRLLPLGDTINRGPDAAGVLRLLQETHALPIVGNHERRLLELQGIAKVPAWAEAPSSAYVQLQRAEKWETACAWMRTWPIIAQGPGWIAVHAGLHPLTPPAQTSPEFLTTVRCCTATGDLPPADAAKGRNPPAGYSPWHEFYRGEEMVFFGHWAAQGLWLRDRVRGLDSGCVYGRQLSAVWWPEDRLVQVDAAQP